MTNLTRITSIKDPRIILARKLNTTRGRLEAGKCLLEGPETLRWAQDANLPIDAVFYSDRTDRPDLYREPTACYVVTLGILKKITGRRHEVPLVGIADLSPIVQNKMPWGQLVLLLDSVQDPGNLGTIIRTARGFGVKDILTVGQGADPFSSRAIVASRGQVFRMHLKQFGAVKDAVQSLRQRGFQLVATSPYGSGLQATVRLEPKPLALIIGNETNGVSPELLEQADLVVQIPMSGRVESLNVGVSTGISLYEMKLKLVMTMLTKTIRATLGRDVNVAGMLIKRALDAELTSVTPLTGDQAILLMVLQCDRVMTLEQVSRDMAVFGPELVQMLDPLRSSGYIQNAQGNDGSAISLTDRGTQILGQLWGVVEATEERVLEGFTEQERQQLMEYIQRVQENCAKILNAGAADKEVS